MKKILLLLLPVVFVMMGFSDAGAWQVTVRNETKWHISTNVPVNVLFGNANKGYGVNDIAPGGQGVADTQGWCPAVVEARVYFPDGNFPRYKYQDVPSVCTLTSNLGWDACTATCWNTSWSVVETSPMQFQLIKR